MKFKKRKYSGLLLCFLISILVLMAGGCGGGDGGGGDSPVDDGGGTPTVVGILEPVGNFKFNENEVADIVEMEYKNNVYKIDGINLYQIGVDTIGLDKNSEAINLRTNKSVTIDALHKGDVIIITPQKKEDVFYSLMFEIINIVADSELCNVAVEAVNIDSIFDKFKVHLKINIDTRFNKNIMAVPVVEHTTDVRMGTRSFVDYLPEITPNDAGGMDIKFDFSEGGQALTATMTNVCVESEFGLDESYAKVDADSIRFNYNATNMNWSEVYYLFEQTFMAGPVPIVLGMELNPYMSLSMSVACEFKKPYAYAKAWIFEAPSNGANRITLDSSCGDPYLQKPTIEANTDGKCGAKLDAKIYVGLPEKIVNDAGNSFKKLFPNVWVLNMLIDTIVEKLQEINAGVYATVADAVVHGRIDNSIDITPAPFIADIAMKHKAGVYCAGFSLDSPEYVSIQYPLLFVVKPHKVSMYNGTEKILSIYPEVKGPDLGLYYWSVDNASILSIERLGNLQNALTIQAQSEGNTNVRCYGPVSEFVCPIEVLPLDDETAETFKIYDADDLLEFADRVNSGESELNGMLMNDIDLLGEQTDALIGVTRDLAYSGVFDGQGFTIRGLNINVVVEYTGWPIDSWPADSTCKGLFGYIDNAEVKNLNVSGKVYCQGFAFESAGIVGDSVNSRILNCNFDGTVENSSAMGILSGICALSSNSAVEQCTNKANIMFTGRYGTVAGVVASAGDSMIAECANNGSVTYSFEPSYAAGSEIGGISGTISDSTIRECVNHGIIYSIHTKAVSVGGIVGRIDEFYDYGTSLIINSINYADVTAYNRVGGIAGEIKTKNQVKQCENYGHVGITMTMPSTENPAFCDDMYGYCDEEDNPEFGHVDVEDPYERL